MSFLVRYFVDGTAFLVAAGVLLIAPLLPALKGRWAARVFRVTAVVALAVVGLSGTPLPLGLYAAWGLAVLLWAIVQARYLPLPSKPALACRLVAALLAAAAIAMEIPRQITPAIAVAPGQQLYVIGDSISAGLDPSRRGSWPECLHRQTGINVVNLAQAGAKVNGAIAQAAGVQEPNAVVLVEIGGNDLMLTPAGAFEADLERLLQLVGGPQRKVILLELPSLPLGNLYGMAQRRLAGRYGAILVPRRVLVNVWATPGATLDGVHLSPAGHEQLAAAIGRLLSPGI